MIIQLQFSEIMCKFVSKIFNLGCVLRIYTRTRDLACAKMKFHKHMRDMRDLLRFKTYFQFNITF